MKTKIFLVLTLAVNLLFIATVSAQPTISPPLSPPKTVPPVQLNFPLRFAEAPSGNIELPGLTGGLITVSTAGGKGAVKLSITAGTHANLVKFDQPTLATTAMPLVNPAVPQVDVSRTIMSAVPAYQPAVPVTQRIRFAGFPSIASMGNVTVTVAAEDSTAARVTASFTIIPLKPRVRQVLLPSGLVRHQKTTLPVDIEYLTPGSSIRLVQSFAASDTQVRMACAYNFVDNNGSVVVTGLANSAGVARIGIPGRFFAYDHAKTGPCGVVLKLLLPANETIEVGSRDVRLTLPTVYTVANTWSLHSKLGFEMSNRPGMCYGVSGLHVIGVHEVLNDLAIGIRSGPIGTDCRANSKAWSLPLGVILTGIDWKVEADGNKCCLGNDCLPDFVQPDTGLVFPGSIPTEEVGAYESNAISDADRPPADSDGFRPKFVSKMHVRLGCKQTVINDHGVKVILNSMTFEGPAGLNFP